MFWKSAKDRRTITDGSKAAFAPTADFFFLKFIL